MSTITPSLLYDYLQCPHKVWRDVHGPRHELVDGENAFLRLLWERGVQHEADIIGSFGYDFVDCSLGGETERIAKTNQALADRAEYIYQGVLAHGDLFGIPDLLYYTAGEYFPIEIKSGFAEEGGDENGGGKLKKRYAVQLALYCEILNRRGLHHSRKGFVIDTTGQRFEYDLSAAQGPKTPETHWEMYLRIRGEVLSLIGNETQNDPAMCSACGNCGWHHSCKKWASETDDLTQLFYIGRTVRDTIKRDLPVKGVACLLSLDAESLSARKRSDKSFLKGIGAASVEKMILRARLMKEQSRPLIHERFDFPDVRTELFFDIESDPTQDFVYLHGFWVRDRSGERFVEFTAREPQRNAEKQAWADAIAFIRSFDPAESAIYYYSNYEKTSYGRLMIRHPDVIGEEDLKKIFDHPNVIDLYSDFILKHTDWPLGSYGIKTIAQYLEFKWRDETPSGALSIQWYNDFLKTGDEGLLTRVLEYNEDDCKATMVVKDYLKQRMDAM